MNDDSSATTPPTDDDPIFHSLMVVMDEVDESLRAQLDQRQDVQGKAATMMGFVGAMVALLLGAQDVIATMSVAGKIVAVVAVGFLVIDLVLLSLVYWVRRYRVDPEPRALAEYLRLPEDKTRLQVLSNKVDRYEQNRDIIERHADTLRAAFTVQVIAIGLLGALLVMAFTGQP